MELAAALHHSWGGGLETHEGLRAQKTASAGPAECFDLFSDDGKGRSGRRHCLSRGRRRGSSGTPGSGTRSPRISRSLCRRWGNSCPMSFSSLLLSCRGLPSRLSKCRRSSWTGLRSVWGIICASRRWWNSWWHVPTAVSYSSLQQLTAEQIVDIPVPGRDGGGARGGLQGFARQSSTASSSRVGAADGAGQGVFRTFPQIKKSAKQGPHSGSALLPESSPSTLSAHQMPLDEQLVDVPVPQVSERSSRSLLYEVLRRRQEAEEAARWREQNALLEDEDEEEDEDDEEEEISRFPPHFHPRRWCQFLLAGSMCPRGWQCTFAHHESELHPDSW